MAENTSIWTRIKNFWRKHPLISGLITLFAVGWVLVAILMAFLGVWTHHNDDATVPEIKQLSYSEAEATLQRANLEIAISDSIYDTSVPAGTVVESWPKAGSQVKAGRKVYVTVTAFSPKNVTLSMPVTGVSVRQAVSYLNALGITGIRFVNVPSEYPNLVERASVGGRPLGVGSMLPVNSEVVLEVGVYIEPEETATDSISTEEQIAAELEMETGETPESTYYEE